MSILDIKDIGAYDNDVVKFLRFFEFPNHSINFEGSSRYKTLRYKSDYDLILFIKNTTPANEVFNNLRKVLEKIEKESDTYFIELKMQTKDDKKFRFYHGDVFSISDFEQHYNDNLAFFKIDMVIRIKDKFYETSGTYRLVPVAGMTLEKVVTDLKDNIKKHIKEGNYYKCLKRMFSIYIMFKNMTQVEFLIKIFNTDMGKLYEVICILQAVELVYEHYSDERTVEKLEKCMKLLDIPFNIKEISKIVEQYKKDLNKHAKTIYLGLKDGKYP